MIHVLANRKTSRKYRRFEKTLEFSKDQNKINYEKTWKFIKLENENAQYVALFDELHLLLKMNNWNDDDHTASFIVSENFHVIQTFELVITKSKV